MNALRRHPDQLPPELQETAQTITAQEQRNSAVSKWTKAQNNYQKAVA